MRQRMIRGAAMGAALAAVAITGGCGQFRESLGLTKNPPDEFQVVAREPLSIPPDFKLRPPKPGAPRPQTGTARDEAEQTVFRIDDESDARETGYQGGNGMSAGERALLTQAGAERAPENIRQLVQRETERLAAENRSFVNRLVFWRDARDPAKVVDAEKEAKRLRENAALGKGVTAGETPTIERGERGFLEGLFGGGL